MVLRNCWKSRHKESGDPLPRWTGPGIGLLVCLSILQCGYSTGAEGITKTVIQKDAEFDVTYNDTVTNDNQTIYAFNHTVSRNKVSLNPIHITYTCYTYTYIKGQGSVINI